MGESFIPGLSSGQALLAIVLSLVFAGAVSQSRIGKRFIIPSMITIAVALLIYDAARERVPVTSSGELVGVILFSGGVGWVAGFIMGNISGEKKSRR